MKRGRGSYTVSTLGKTCKFYLAPLGWDVFLELPCYESKGMNLDSLWNAWLLPNRHRDVEGLEGG